MLLMSILGQVLHGLFHLVEKPRVGWYCEIFPLTSSCFRFLAFLYTVCRSFLDMSFFVLSNQSVNFSSTCFIRGFLWLYVVITLILLSSIFFVDISNSSCDFDQALSKAVSRILSG